MLRSLSSGVAGMKSHQTRLDVIGNNISNVNTYGFKSSRTTFSSVYYQTTAAAKGSSAISGGGTNSTQIGYGAQVFGIDTLMTRSGFSSTGVSTDLAIAGEGFFQVMSGDGSVYYTRNGAFKFDSAGYLVDTNGNYVLGTNGSTLGQTAQSNPIKVNLTSINPSNATYSDTINGKTLSISSQNKVSDANVTFTFSEGTNFLDSADRVSATVMNGAIAISINPAANFTDEDDFNKAVNAAIILAYGEPHPAGDFTISITGADWGATGLSGAELLSTDYGTQVGSVNGCSEMNSLGMKISTVGNAFSATSTTADAKFSITQNVTGTTVDSYDVKFEVDGKTYTRNIAASETGSSIKLKNAAGTAEDWIAVSIPSFADLTTSFNKTGTAVGGTYSSATYDASAVSSAPSRALGLSTSSFQLTGGTSGGAQSISDLTNISIDSGGNVTATHATLGTIEIGTITIATFSNPSGLDQASSTYFTTSANSGTPDVTYAGSEGAGSLQSGALEMSNVDLSTEMSDMIITERGFQAASRIITTSDEVLQELINLKR